MSLRTTFVFLSLLSLLLFGACGGTDAATTSGSSGGCGLATCGGVCTDTRFDPTNCGGCGTACAAGQVCSQGSCAAACGAGTITCGALCVDSMVDANNCGGCGAKCPAGEVCSNGACGSSCTGGTTECAGVCVNTNANPSHCGGCGNACGAGEVCSGGVCGVTCLGGTTQCGGSCSDTKLDPANCGGCGNACAMGEVCSQGLCGLSCGGGTSLCGSKCSDKQTDAANCGQCGNLCPQGELCSQGTCGVVCLGGTSACNGACVNTTNDPAHCGMCNQPCTQGQVCSMSSCGLSCVGGSTRCGNLCVDTQNDPAHCGSCPKTCAANEVCTAGVCGPTCPSPNQLCGNSCVNTQHDPSHCGMCGLSCSLGQACLASKCVSVSGGVLASCAAIKAATPSSTDGVYPIDPDGPGGNPQFNVYCDMTQNSGGWTLIARFANVDASNWIDSGTWWYDRVIATGTTTSRSVNADMYSLAFHTVKAAEFKLTRTDSSDAALLRTTGNCLANASFRSKITGYGDFRTAVWGTSNTKGDCAIVYGGLYTTTNGFAQYGCAVPDIGAAAKVSFWADWSSGDGAVMMIGGGGTSCSRADHGIAVTEANDAQFGSVCSGCSSRDDFGNNGSDQNDTYALNLFVR